MTQTSFPAEGQRSFVSPPGSGTGGMANPSGALYTGDAASVSTAGQGRVSLARPAGVGEDILGGTPIATIPAQALPAPTGHVVSERTGEPKRPFLVMVSIVLAWLSAAILVGAFSWWWWRAATVDEFHDSARILTWTHPDPVSVLAIVMVLVVGAMTVLMVTAAGIVAYNAWVGTSWVRIAGLVALGVLCLSFLMNWWFTYAMIPLAIAAGLLWTPHARRFVEAMVDMRTPKIIDVPTENILYGRQPLVGIRGTEN